MPHRIRLTRIVSMADQLAAQLQGLHFTNLQAQAATWQPAVNVYAHAGCIEVCMDLAGVRKQDIKVEVEQRSLTIRGHREAPDSGFDRSGCCRILVMEIADGTFERILDFPVNVDAARVVARQENGLLWVTLPIIQPEDAS